MTGLVFRRLPNPLTAGDRRALKKVKGKQPSIQKCEVKGFEELKSFAKDKGGTNKRKQDLSIKLIKLHYYGLCLFINNSCSTEKIVTHPRATTDRWQFQDNCLRVLGPNFVTIHYCNLYS